MKKIFFIISLHCLFANKLPNDVRWITASNEYQALCSQIYDNAINNLNLQIAKNPYSLNIVNKSKYAIVMDLDETVLDNSQYQVELFEKNESFNIDSWAQWVNREEAELVPGAKKYIDVIRQANIQLIFISNRMHERLNATINNMKRLNIYLEKDIFLLRKDKKDKKNIRRKEIFESSGRMKNYNSFVVLQYIGDAMGDFPLTNLNQFGLTQYVLPNPMYGKW